MLSVEQLTKVYGSRTAIRDLSFDVRPGEVLGLLGPNGAGKTTTMRLIAGYMPPTSGTVRIDGHDVRTEPLAAKARVGYLPETPPVYREMTVRSYLRFVAELRRVPKGRAPAAIDRALSLCGLKDVAHRVIGHLSKGYRQRVGLAQAILHEPALLILDEPTVGLDPKQVIEMREVISGVASGQMVVLSTHILPEVQRVCSRVVIIHEGRIVAADSVESLASGGSLEKAFLEVVAGQPGQGSM